MYEITNKFDGNTCPQKRKKHQDKSRRIVYLLNQRDFLHAWVSDTIPLRNTTIYSLHLCRKRNTHTIFFAYSSSVYCKNKNRWRQIKLRMTKLTVMKRTPFSVSYSPVFHHTLLIYLYECIKSRSLTRFRSHIFIINKREKRWVNQTQLHLPNRNMKTLELV